MQYNINSGWGDKLVQGLSFNPTGSIFVVGDSSTVNKDRIQQLFRDNPDGVVTYHQTLDEALSRCTNDAGDIIYILPGHTETIDSTSDAVIDKSGVTIIGLGNGSLIPTFQCTSTDDCVYMSAADATLKNVRIEAYSSAGSNNVSGILLRSSGAAAKNITLDGIRFEKLTSGTFDTICKISTDGGSTTAGYFSGLTIKNSHINYNVSAVTGGTGVGFYIVTNQINDFTFTGNEGSAVSSGNLGVLYSSGGSAVMKNWNVSDNRINNLSTSLLVCNLLTTGIDGIAVNNYWSGSSTGAYGTMVDMGNLRATNNYVNVRSAADHEGRIHAATCT